MPVTASTSTTDPGQGQTDISPETLETTLVNHLSSTPALEDLHATLLTSLQRTGWTERIRQLTLELLRAGRCERFDEVVDVVVASAEGRGHSALSNTDTGSTGERSGSGSKNGDDGLAGGLENVDVTIPPGVVEEGVKALKEVLGEVVVLEEARSGTGGGVDVAVPAVKDGEQ